MKNVPQSTYRLQFNSAFTFQSAKAIASYLHDFGISHIYASPIFKAVSGSNHGYDVVDTTTINPEIGAEKDFNELHKKLKNLGLEWIQDIVPNHMAFHGQNQWLMDVLEKGTKSQYCNYFDIEWKDTYRSLKGKLLAPFLGRFYSQCLEDKEIRIAYDQKGLSINYNDLRLPLNISTYPDVLLLNLYRLNQKSKKILEYVYLAKKFQSSSIKNKRAYNNQIEKLKLLMWELYTKESRIKQFINQNIRLLNGKKGDVNSFQLLDQLLAKQLFRLTFWKFGAEEINYRRFFNINQLISLRVENKEIFEKTHCLAFDWINQGKVSGLRVDHIDGLYAPKQYLQKLRQNAKDCYLIAEKILEFDEQLPPDWPIEGTTGYDFLNCVNALFVNQKNENAFNTLYMNLTNQNIAFDELVSSKKRLIIGKHMAGDIDNLAHHMKRISHKDRYGRDITSYGLKRALVEVLTYFPQYRTYIGNENIGKEARICIEEAVRKSKDNNPGLVYELDFIADTLLLNFNNYLTKAEKNHWIHFVRRFQQFTGPLMAKGFEDTTLYIYNRLISLNEVGGAPDHFGIVTKDFHHFHHTRRIHWPNAMNATATHDTKRGEDIRARINILSEIPEEWHRKVKSWQKINYNKKVKLKNKAAPDANDEYFLYQTMLGGYPSQASERKQFKQRLKDCLIKSVREAKIHTAWIQPDDEYEKICISFIDDLLKPSTKNSFLRDFLKFQKKIATYGIYNSLSQTLIKMTAPGVPDIYQGTELWDLNFVDPDNRRAVDYKKRVSLLKDIKNRHKMNAPAFIKKLIKEKESGQIKMFLIWKVLTFREQNHEIFLNGRYISLKTTGIYKNHIISFARKSGKASIITIIPRFLTSVARRGQEPLGKIWKDTKIIIPNQIKNNEWEDVIAGNLIESRKSILVRDILKYFPVALLSNRRSNETG